MKKKTKIGMEVRGRVGGEGENKPTNKSKQMISPATIRKKIGELDHRIFLIQNALSHEPNPLRRTQMIDLQNAMTDKKRQLFFILHELEERGKLIEEKERKRLEAWHKFEQECNMAGKCPQNKPAVNEGCEECPHLKLMAKTLETIPEKEVEEILKEKKK